MKIKLKSIRHFNELLIKKGFSKRALARVANIGEATANQVSNGIRNPSPVIAAKITSALDVDFDDIFTIEHKEVKQVDCRRNA